MWVFVKTFYSVINLLHYDYVGTDLVGNKSDMVKKLITPKHVIELTEKEVTLTYLALKDFRQKLMKNEEDAGPCLDDAHVVDSLMTKLDSLPELEAKFFDE